MAAPGDVNFVVSSQSVPHLTVDQIDLRPATDKMGKFYFAKFSLNSDQASSFLKIIFVGQTGQKTLIEVSGADIELIWADLTNDQAFREIIMDNDNYIRLQFNNNHGSQSKTVYYEYHWIEV